jgi:hypothetical protein
VRSTCRSTPRAPLRTLALHPLLNLERYVWSAVHGDEVAVTRVSTGASFVSEPRRSLPITPV